MRLCLFLACVCKAAVGLNVAVAGATGRTGQLVVNELLAEGHRVLALTRDLKKAASVLPVSESNLECRKIDLATCSGDAMREACNGADRLLWCATGFTDRGESIDLRGMADLIPAAFGAGSATAASPTVVMLSSAGVTRPDWSDTKKEKLIGASDIPIIRLNPGGILGKKFEAEQRLRESCVPYCVVRPTGLKFEDWPRGRPIFSQGDVAVGRTNVDDLARVLAQVLDEPSATGKTFEMFTIAGYPAPRSLSPALERLTPDAQMPLDEHAVEATYNTLQQLLPGEEQDATKLEMGRTYEQVDAGAAGEEGGVAPRERGAAPTERELALASGVAAGGQTRGGIRGWVGKLLKK